METIQKEIGALQTSVKRQRFAIVALAGIIVAGGFIAAVRPAGDATFDMITCKAWKVVDADGKARIVAEIFPGGQAIVIWLDKDGKPRIAAGTMADGQASVQWFDKDKKVKIAATTFPDGTVILPTKDDNPPKKP